MNASGKLIFWIVLMVIASIAMYEFGHIRGSISAIEEFDEVGHLQLLRIERALNVIDALKAKTILPDTGNTAAQIVNSILVDFMQISQTLSEKQKKYFCEHVNDPDVLLLLNSEKLYGTPQNNWDQNGVKGVLEFCRK